MPPMSRAAVTAAVLALALAAGAGAAKTPYPPPTGGSGAEPTGGAGIGAGVAFHPRFALATYEPIGGHYVLYLTRTPVPCTRTYLAKPPYLTVSVVTGSPLVVGKPSLQRGAADFVQVDFFVSPTHYYAVQPGVKLVLTRVDASPNGVWHGTVAVPTTRFEGKTFSFEGTFAARWCGRVS
jgi:hypothetical protein